MAPIERAKPLQPFTTYQLKLKVCRSLRVAVGRLGIFTFPAGSYCYTGSAKRGLEARIARHLRTEKKLRWHIDYLLASEGVQITGVERSQLPECILNQSVDGRIVVAGFGASDCRSGCGSHLKWIDGAAL